MSKGRRPFPVDRPCSLCGKSYPEVVFDFYIGPGGANLRISACKTCKKANKKNRYSKECSYLNKYNLSLKDAELIWASQEGRCAICAETISNPSQGDSTKTHVDHDHKTNTIRGLLCSDCNSGLGFFKDDKLRLQEAIRYLSRDKKFTP